MVVLVFLWANAGLIKRAWSSDRVDLDQAVRAAPARAARRARDTFNLYRHGHAAAVRAFVARPLRPPSRGFASYQLKKTLSFRTLCFRTTVPNLGSLDG